MTSDFIAVIDGSTSKTDIRYSSKVSNGRLCMQIISQVISNDLPCDANVFMFCDLVTNKVASYYSKVPDRPNNDLMAASVVVYSVSRREVWLIGDCQFLINGCLYDNPKPEETIIAKRRSDYIRTVINQGKCTIDDLRMHDIGRDHILVDLRCSCDGANINYAVVNGMKIPRNLIKVYPADFIGYDAEQKMEIVLASDGYPWLESTLRESERKLANLILDDPLCINLYIATKGVMTGNRSFDDRSYVRFSVNKN